ncbi:MAG: hypothetical protein M1820_010448 [Bogoriella megaspora]|nr:MAG: hypothetical protein M1820_010448 [Bogoriella megaspora]
MHKDLRFCNLPFVNGEAANLSYHCGVPLQTKRGINIGSLLVLDKEPKPPVSRANLDFLEVMAENVIQHYEMMRERRMRRRAWNLSMSLASFVDPDCLVKPIKLRVHEAQDLEPRRLRSIDHQQRKINADHDTKMEDFSTDQVDPNEPAMSRSDSLKSAEWDRERSPTFVRAAELLGDSLDLEDGGGVVFMDTMATIRDFAEGRPGSPTEASIREDASVHVPISNNKPGMATFESEGFLRHLTQGRPRSPSEQTAAAKFLSSFYFTGRSGDVEPRASRSGEIVPDDIFSAIPISLLASLIKRYPRGKMYTFDDDFPTPVEDQVQQSSFFDTRHGERNETHTSESLVLQQYFPHARQVIFAPIRNHATSSYSVCFVYNTSELRHFTYGVEYLHVLAFCNCITAELVQLATQESDEQKSKFIGSISHELRSPLHGILGSCEFIEDTECSSFQRSLVGTTSSCARTLLDTIDMLLDYSKINAFERDWRNAGKRRSGKIETNESGETKAANNIFSSVDLAVVTEEVVEGVTVGHPLSHSFDFNSSNTTLNLMTPSAVTGLPKHASFENQIRRSDVEVIIDIPSKEWLYITQPGSFRRIIMNLVGNSLKYTKTGRVTVRLDSRKQQWPSKGMLGNPPDIVSLSVSDTGAGISSEYLQKKIFTPFSQENILEPGTGLGLSLVRSIVKMLDGKIDIKSQLGVGTEVVVQLPLLRDHSCSLSPLLGSSPPTPRQHCTASVIHEVQTMVSDHRIGYFWGAGVGKTGLTLESLQEMRTTTRGYLATWFGESTLVDWAPGRLVSVIVVDECDYFNLLRTFADSARAQPLLLVLCSRSSAQFWLKLDANSARIELLSKPFGPNKLARAMKCCLDRIIAGNNRDSKPALTDLKQETTNHTLNKVPGHVLPRPTITAEVLLELGKASTGKQEPTEYPFPVAVTKRTTESSIPTSVASSIKDTTATAREALPNWAFPPISRDMLDLGANLMNRGVREPRCLCVDDNEINLRLLVTFMRKREHQFWYAAMNGEVAFNIVKDNYGSLGSVDIIFMDISMPIMSGIDATKQIREFERSVGTEGDKKVLIVAFTGLAAREHQGNALDAGMDLYLTKPVKFKEVGRILDEWVAAEAKKSREVP